jgi:SAM-dependent methyltransferase
MSSVEGDEAVLQSLHSAMMDFYSEKSKRSNYQSMLDDIDKEPGQNSSTTCLGRYINQQKPDRVLEVGCGNGRLFRTLTREGFRGDYTGVEVAKYMVDRNRGQHSEATWHTATAYNLPVGDESVDIACAEFVLEHLVYPVQGLREMLRVVSTGGKLILFFPDFACSGRFGSQFIGLSPSRTATRSLREGSLLDAVMSLYDSRVRLPGALETAQDKVGPFPVNLRPKCLAYPDHTFPDVDAVYIASKSEVEGWAKENDYSVFFPKGREGKYYETAFMCIEKSR